MDDYSTDELQVHFEAAIRHRSHLNSQLATTIRVANNAKKKDFVKYIRGLEETGWRIDLDMGRVHRNPEAILSGLDALLAKRGRRR